MPNVYDGYSKDEPNGERFIRHVSAEVMKARFLELYSVWGHVSHTCRVLGIAPRNVYRWRQNDEEFSKNWIIAEELALGLLEDEATRRAMIGVEKPVFQGGKQVGTVIEYSDMLLVTLLKARAPHKYKDRFAGELTGPDGKGLLDGVKITHVHTGLGLANSEDQILLEQTKKPTVEDISFEETKEPPHKDELDSL